MLKKCKKLGDFGPKNEKNWCVKHIVVQTVTFCQNPQDKLISLEGSWLKQKQDQFGWGWNVQGWKQVVVEVKATSCDQSDHRLNWIELEWVWLTRCCWNHHRLTCRTYRLRLNKLSTYWCKSNWQVHCCTSWVDITFRRNRFVDTNTGRLSWVERLIVVQIVIVLCWD